MYKAPYPFLLSLELAAAQIIAVDTVQNSDFCIAGYLMNAGHFSKNNVSTGDLNRSPGVERAAALRLLPVLFVEAKRT